MDSPLLKNVLAVILGLFVGMTINMGLIVLGSWLIPPPEGIDVTSEASLQANAHLLGIQNFIFPFLAHALGTLGGAFIAAKIAANNHLRLAMGIGVFFLVGGIMMVMSIQAPLAFDILDLGLAYIPMAWLGYFFGSPARE